MNWTNFIAVVVLPWLFRAFHRLRCSGLRFAGRFETCLSIQSALGASVMSPLRKTLLAAATVAVVGCCQVAALAGSKGAVARTGAQAGPVVSNYQSQTVAVGLGQFRDVTGSTIANPVVHIDLVSRDYKS